ncbi:MAG: protein jag [Clostridia bacterium]|nr:protein jag [Clostridia bacterium]
MRVVEKSAKTVEEAIELALTELDLDENQVEIYVLEQPTKGFLGLIGSKNALVRVTEKYNVVDEAQKFLKKICSMMEIDPNINIVNNSEDNLEINLTGDNLGLLIGRRGDTLDALQFILNLVINKNCEKRIKIILDVENYRSKREETLFKLAKRLSEKAKKTGKKIVLEPMNPHERRIIHMSLQEDHRINTYSEGEEPYRKVVIVPKKI